MTPDEARLRRLLNRAARIRDEDLEGIVDGPEARNLFEAIVSLPQGASSGRSTATSVARRPTGRWTRWSLSLRPAAAFVLALITVAGIAAVSTILIQPEPARAAVAITRREGFFVARVTDPDASRRRLSAAFQRLGLDIELDLVPVSPSLVGTIVAVSESPGPVEIGTLLDDDQCEAGGGSCPIGLRVPHDFRGHAEITLGREAKQGERYVSAASPLDHGEPLHCLEIYGESVEDAHRSLETRGLAVILLALVERDGRQYAELASLSDVSDWHVQDVNMLSAGEVVIHASPEPVPPPPTEDRLGQDCR